MAEWDWLVGEVHAWERGQVGRRGCLEKEIWRPDINQARAQSLNLSAKIPHVAGKESPEMGKLDWLV
jgi:hypothetical protein